MPDTTREARRKARRARRGWKWPEVENRFARYALWGAAQGLVAAFVPLGLLAGLGFQLDATESLLSGLGSVAIGVVAALLFFSLLRARSRWLVPLAFPLISTTIPLVDTLGGNWLSCRSLLTCDNSAGTGGLDLAIMNCWALALLVVSLPAAIWYLRRLLAEQAAMEEVEFEAAPPREPDRSRRPRKRRR